MSATTPAYQAVTILAVIVGAALLIFMAIVSTQNERKWSVLDTAKQMIVGPVSQLGIGYPSTLAGSSASLLLRNTLGVDQFSMFTQTNPSRPDAPYFTITGPTGPSGTPTGRADIPLPLKL